MLQDRSTPRSLGHSGGKEDRADSKRCRNIKRYDAGHQKMRSSFVVYVVVVCFALFCFVSIFLFNERRGRVTSSVMITKTTTTKKEGVNVSS